MRSMRSGVEKSMRGRRGMLFGGLSALVLLFAFVGCMINIKLC